MKRFGAMLLHVFFGVRLFGRNHELYVVFMCGSCNLHLYLALRVFSKFGRFENKMTGVSFEIGRRVLRSHVIPMVVYVFFGLRLFGQNHQLYVAFM